MLREGTSPESDKDSAADETLRELLSALETAGVTDDKVTEVVTESLGRKTNGLTHGNGASPEVLELSENARTVLEKRYLRKDDDGNSIETPVELFHRVAHAVAQGEDEDVRQVWEDRYFEYLTSLKFLPNSPTLVNAGTGRGCLSACFVVSPEDTLDSIMDVARDGAMIEKWGGGIGFGFSGLRPRTDRISTTHGFACGPIAVMRLYSAVGDRKSVV